MRLIAVMLSLGIVTSLVAAPPTSQPTTKPSDLYPVLQKRVRDLESENAELRLQLAQVKIQVTTLQAEAKATADASAGEAAATQSPAAKGSPRENAFRDPEDDKSAGGDLPGAAAAGDENIVASFVSIADARVGHTLTVRLTNVSGKQIKAIKGGVYFYDQFGDEIGHSGAGIDIDDAMQIAGSIDKAGVWPMLDARVASILSKSPKDVTIKWKTTKVAFAN